MKPSQENMMKTMWKKLSTFAEKNRSKEAAQSMVEFALALPILLMVAIGLLEVGRLLFTYSSVVTAAREAARYGSVTGLNDGGVPRYQDCFGIRAAARKVAFISDFEDAGMNIVFDSGPGTTAFATCNGVDFVAVEPQNGDRLTVFVSTTFSPVVPLIPLDTITIQSSSSRTFLMEIEIEATAGTPGNTPTPTNTFTPTSTATNTSTPTATHTMTLTPEISPTPSNTPTATFTPTNTLVPTFTHTATATSTATNIPSPTSTSVACNVSHTGLSIGSKMSLTVNNDSYSPITISKMTIFYYASSPSGQAITEIESDDETVWAGSISGSPVSISSFTETIQIDPWSNIDLEISFNKNLKTNGTELILINFVENGCPVLDTSN